MKTTSKDRDRIQVKTSVSTRAPRFLFFQIGIAAVLLFSLIVLESYTYEPKGPVRVYNYVDENPENEWVDSVYTIIPNQPKPQPQPSPRATSKAPVSTPVTTTETDNWLKVDNTEIQQEINKRNDEYKKTDTEKSNEANTETNNQKDAPVDNKPAKPVPIAVVSRMPIFPGCEKYTDQVKARECFQEKIKRFVQRKFDTTVPTDLKEGDMVHIHVQFTIDKDGSIQDIKTNKVHQSLIDEAIETIGRLPKFEPGQVNGKPVRVIYTLPINFRVRR
jgi:protein TonB